MLKIKEGFEKYQVAPGMLGVSASMIKIGKLIKLAAADDDNLNTIFITGETGAGKDVVANAIYKEFKLKKPKPEDVPFVHANICAISPALLESELFGHVKGSFTGANKDREGLIKSADGGVLYLDEIGDLPLELQVKLLHFIQYRNIRAVGSNEEIKVDVKLVLGTHRNLLKQIKEKKFRSDLYYRVLNISITIPPLRERVEDIPIFINHHLHQSNGGVTINEEALQKLIHYPWPGNVRQLLSVINMAIFSMEYRILDTDKDREILLEDINTSIFEVEGLYVFGNIFLADNSKQIICNLIKNGMDYKSWCNLYKLLLLQDIPGTKVFKAALAGKVRVEIYRWEEALGVKSLEKEKDKDKKKEDKD